MQNENLGEILERLRLEQIVKSEQIAEKIVEREKKSMLENIHKMNIKKGDVLVLRPNTENSKIPAHVLRKVVRNIKKDIHTVLDIPILIIPKNIDVEIIRLEEWFV